MLTYCNSLLDSLLRTQKCKRMCLYKYVLQYEFKIDFKFKMNFDAIKKFDIHSCYWYFIKIILTDYTCYMFLFFKWKCTHKCQMFSFSYPCIVFSSCWILDCSLRIPTAPWRGRKTELKNKQRTLAVETYICVVAHCNFFTPFVIFTFIYIFVKETEIWGMNLYKYVLQYEFEISLHGL